MERRLAAILAADVVGYSRLIRADEVGTLAAFKAIRVEVIDSALADHHGRLVKLMGDGVLAEFGSAVDAVQAATEIQRAMVRHNADVAENRRLRFRVGINLGDVVVDGDDIHGDGVNVAARLEGLADPDGVCVSDNVYEQVRDRLDLAFEDLGEQEVKNIGRPVRTWRWLAGGLGVGAAPLSLPDRPSIAVLPFDNMSSNADDDFLADGIAEDILTGLSRVRWLFVISRNSSFAYRGQKIDVKRVAEELGVRYILEGSLRRSGNRARVTAQLIDAADDRHVWAERYDRELEDIFDLQDEITETILGRLEPELGLAEQDRARRKPPENLDAWDLYLRGQWHLYRFTAEDADEAARYYRAAIEKDRDFAAAHVGLAYAIYLGAIEAFSDDPAACLDEAIIIARKAVDLDNKDPWAYSVLARILSMRHEHEAALAASEISLELNPHVSQSRFGRAFALVFAGRYEEAIAEIDQAIRLSPRDPNTWSIITVKSWGLMALERYEEAVTWARRAASEPNAVLWHYAVMASSLGHLGRLDEARNALDKFRSENPHMDPEEVWQRLPFVDSTQVDRMAEGTRLAAGGGSST